MSPLSEASSRVFRKPLRLFLQNPSYRSVACCRENKGSSEGLSFHKLIEVNREYWIEESAISVERCWIVKYLCKIDCWSDCRKVYINIYIFFFLVRSHLRDSKIMGYKKEKRKTEQITLWEIRGAIIAFMLFFMCLFVCLSCKFVSIVDQISL